MTIPAPGVTATEALRSAELDARAYALEHSDCPPEWLAEVLSIIEEGSPVAQRNATSVLLELGQGAVEPILRFLRQGASRSKTVLVELLVEIGAPAVPAVSAAVNPMHPNYSHSVLTAALRLDPSLVEEFERQLVASLISPDGEVSAIASDAVVSMRGLGVYLLVPLLESPDPYAQQNATNALIRIGSSAVEPLLLMLDHRSPFMQQNALRALSEIGVSLDRLQEAERVASGQQLQYVRVLKQQLSRKSQR